MTNSNHKAEATQFFLASDFSDGYINLKVGQEVCPTHGDENISVCEVEFAGEIVQIIVPNHLISC
jgi:hypothetical protein